MVTSRRRSGVLLQPSHAQNQHRALQLGHHRSQLEEPSRASGAQSVARTSGLLRARPQRLDNPQPEWTHGGARSEHAFANPSNSRYDQKSAEAAFVEVRKFLAENLKSR